MNGYVVLKQSTFNGESYPKGAFIPADAVLPSRVPALIRSGVIANVDDISNTVVTGAEIALTADLDEGSISLPIAGENGTLALVAKESDIVTAVRVLQMRKDDALKEISEIESENALVIIDACTKTQEIKKAIKNRAEELDRDGED